MPSPLRRLAAVPRSGGAAVRRVYGGAPLRVKLVAVLLLLVVCALAGSGFVAATTLRHYLVGRVDAQLASAADPIQSQPQVSALTGSGGGHGHDGDGDGDNRNHLPSLYVAQVTDAAGRPVYRSMNSLADPGQPLPAFPSVTGVQTKARGTHYVTVNAVRGDEVWRVRVSPITLAGGASGTLLVAQSLSDVENTAKRLVGLFLIIDAVTIIVLAGVGYLVVRASLRPLRDVEQTAAQIARGDLSHRVPDADPRTEVGHLAGALNTMLGRIETAFAQQAESEAAARQSEDRMRRFIADASHELRTPLTSIRGFAELFRQGAAADDADVRRMMARIEGEAKRMGLLVEDLLLLARLDEERPLALAPVDLLALATDAVHDARAAAPDRRVSLEVTSADPPPVVTGDEARLRQVLANLLGNALKHTPVGTPVTVRVGTTTDPAAGGIVVLEVADAGPGMSEQAAARVFERFYRADESRRTNGSTGLGLAIVAALVAGHAGRVTVQTAPGAGACFRVELPLAQLAPLPS